MKPIYIISFLLIIVSFNSCKIKNYPRSYIIYRGDKEIYFPNYKIEIVFKNDSTAYFKNYLLKDSVFIQKFNYYTSESSFLHINNLDTINSNFVSLRNNDTIVIFKGKMYYFHNGKEKAFLYFKKKDNR